MRLRSLFVLAFTAAPLVAQSATPRDAMVVTPAWLASHLDDPNLVLLHVGDSADYAKNHIAGARLANLSRLSMPAGDGRLTLEMPPAAELRNGLAELGISDRSRIVVYFTRNLVTQATRVVLTLQHAGLGAQTSLLTGGMPAWIAAGHPVTADVTPRKTGELSALTLQPIVVDAEYVRRRVGQPGFAVIDARTPSFYDGAQTGGGQAAPHKTGHIAGAKSVPYTDVNDEKLVLKPADQLAALFANAGVAKGDTIIGYCHIGQQATTLLFAARSLGFPVKLYDGSFEDWSRRDLPVEVTKKP